jgi:hypothetical protein
MSSEGELINLMIAEHYLEQLPSSIDEFLAFQAEISKPDHISDDPRSDEEEYTRLIVIVTSRYRWIKANSNQNPRISEILKLYEEIAAAKRFSL